MIVFNDLKSLEKELNAHEKMHNFALLNEEWTPENGILTAALKLRRKVIATKYAEIIKNLF